MIGAHSIGQSIPLKRITVGDPRPSIVASGKAANR